MEPLIDELIKAWEEGVWTYDRATKTNFRDSEDDIPPSNSTGYVDIADSDDEDYDPANPDCDGYF